MPEDVRFTAQLVLSEFEAYVALAQRREPRGPNGETHIARLLHTDDGGARWRSIPWKRSLLNQLRYPGFPTWPPEALMGIAKDERGLVVIHRDEWVPFEPGGESLWESRFDGSVWASRKLRPLDCEREDNPAIVAAIALDLPMSIAPPR